MTALRGEPRCVVGDFGGERTRYEEKLTPVLYEAKDISQQLEEVGLDELPAYQEMEYNHRTVIHTGTYVSADGDHMNQVECLRSLILPWLEKFRGLSRPDLEQAARSSQFF